MRQQEADATPIETTAQLTMSRNPSQCAIAASASGSAGGWGGGKHLATLFWHNVWMPDENSQILHRRVATTASEGADEHTIFNEHYRETGSWLREIAGECRNEDGGVSAPCGTI